MLIPITCAIATILFVQSNWTNRIFAHLWSTGIIHDTVREAMSRNLIVESHYVTTSDGYVLRIFRIYQEWPPPGEVVLFQHGLLSNSTDWVSVDGSIAFRLVEKGWDVWLSNHRGNSYARDHATIPLDDWRFWEFSYHELGVYDLPAVIDYILKRVDRAKIAYVGHSQGCAGFLAMASVLPEMNNKVSAMFALAPVAGLTNAKKSFPVMYHMAKLVGVPRTFLSLLSVNKIGGDLPWFIQTILYLVLPLLRPLITHVARQIMKDNTSFPCANVSDNCLEFFLLFRLRNGASWRQIEHFSQSLIGKFFFHHFDYGAKENMRIYGRRQPPKYDLGKITTNISLIWGQSDDLVLPEDLVALMQKLKYKKILIVPNYKHLDFVASNRHNDMIIDHIVKTVQSTVQTEVRKDSDAASQASRFRRFVASQRQTMNTS